MKLKKTIYTLVELVFVILIIISVVKIYKWNREKKSINNELKITNKAIIGKTNRRIIDFNKLKEQNKDTVGWLTIKNTNIDYPVVQTDNNNFYLDHSFLKRKNQAGWIFMDYHNKLDGTDKNIIIYGHNRLDNIMFGSLKKVLDNNWSNNKDNLNIKFITPNEKNTYQVFSIYKIKSEEYYLNTVFNNNKKYLEFIKKLKNRSIKNFNTDTSDTKQILTLSTCTTNNDYRLVVHAKKIQTKKD